MRLIRRKKYEAIVIGASAGGFHAVSEILSGISPDYAIPFILVQHRARGFPDLFEEVLQRKCSIRIKQADEKEAIAGGTVYVAPPDYHLLIETDKTFSLASDQPVLYSRPSINVLFESAAAVFKERLVGIILSGANSDGAAGISEIKRMGGLTIAQDPAEAEFNYMVQASVNTGNVTHVWRLKHISDFLHSLV